jgi:hypothetical protein
MNSVEWNKKEDLLQDQALRHVKNNIPLLNAFTTNARSELALLNKIQEYCYANMAFLQTFNKVVLLLYKSEYTLRSKLQLVFDSIYKISLLDFHLL